MQYTNGTTDRENICVLYAYTQDTQIKNFFWEEKKTCFPLYIPCINLGNSRKSLNVCFIGIGFMYAAATLFVVYVHVRFVFL